MIERFMEWLKRPAPYPKTWRNLDVLIYSALYLGTVWAFIIAMEVLLWKI